MTWNNLGIAGVKKMLENVPINRLAKVDEVAKLIYTLGSKENTYIGNMTGEKYNPCENTISIYWGRAKSTNFNLPERLRQGRFNNDQG